MNKKQKEYRKDIKDFHKLAKKYGFLTPDNNEILQEFSKKENNNKFR